MNSNIVVQTSAVKLRWKMMYQWGVILKIINQNHL